MILLDPIFRGLAISLSFGLAFRMLLTVLVIPAIDIRLRGGPEAILVETATSAAPAA